MAALGPVPQVVQPLEMEQEVPRRRDVHKLQLSLLLARLDRLVAGSSQDIVLFLLVEVNRDDDVLFLVVKLHSHEGFQRHSPLQIFVCSLGAGLVGEASIHVHHPHERQHHEPLLQHQESVLLQDECVKLVAVLDPVLCCFL